MPLGSATIASMEPAIGIIGGSGLYEMDGLEKRREINVDTPFGPPSDILLAGELAGRTVYFLPRHGRGHRLLPTELPHQANLWALRSLGVRFILCVTAVGSLREELHPEDMVVVDQFLDRTSRREHHTFFGKGIVGHVAFAEPTSAELSALVVEEARRQNRRVHDGGTYVCMDGPAFSTRAESENHRRMGGHVIGMTNLPEAKLAREAEIALATLAMVTDYDCWKTDEPPVTAEAVMAHVHANSEAAKAVIRAVIPRLPRAADWPAHRSLDGAIMTPRHLWPEESRRRLLPLLERFG